MWSSTPMAVGTPRPVTARCGTQTSRPAGYRTPMADGSGSHHGAGLGSTPRPGVSRRAITGAGLYVSGAVGPQVGWFPLAPGETYWPSYTAEPSYIRRLNQANVGSIDDVQIVRNVMLPAQVGNAQFANRRFATVAPQHVFAGARQIVPAAHHVPAAVLEHASVTMRPPQV